MEKILVVDTLFEGNNIIMNDSFHMHIYTAISINVVGLNLQTYKSRPNGAMGIYCNLHITIEEIYKFVFLHVEYFVFLSVKPFLYLFFRRYVVWIILFK